MLCPIRCLQESSGDGGARRGYTRCVQPRITLAPVGDLTALGQRWQALEAQAEAGFFRSWVFLGCLAEARFGDARLLSVTQDGADLALALVGGAHGRGWLNETGIAAQDTVFIEHNGLLVRRGHEAVAQAALGHTAGRTGRLDLAGIDDATMATARKAGWVALRQSRFAPCVTLGWQGRAYLDTLSANARAQIRRSARLYGAGLRLERAATLQTALAWFDELVDVHQAAWTRRGRPGAFAGQAMRQFHTALIARAWELSQADLLRVSAGPLHIGTLYNFVRDGRVLCYQSGFAYDLSDARLKPGLVCHALAIEHYAAEGQCSYDLLAGADRYKRSLADSGQALHWATLYPRRSAVGLARCSLTALKRHIAGL